MGFMKQWRKWGAGFASVIGLGLLAGVPATTAYAVESDERPILMDVVPYDVSFNKAELDDTFGEGKVDAAHAKKDGYVRTNDVVGFKAKFENIRSTDGLRYEDIEAYLVVDVEDNAVNAPWLGEGKRYAKVPSMTDTVIGGVSRPSIDASKSSSTGEDSSGFSYGSVSSTIYYSPRISNQSSGGNLTTGMSVGPSSVYEMRISALTNGTKIKPKYYVQIFGATRVNEDGSKETLRFKDYRLDVSNPFGTLTVSAGAPSPSTPLTFTTTTDYALRSIQAFSDISIDDNDWTTYEAIRFGLTKPNNFNQSLAGCLLAGAVGMGPMKDDFKFSIKVTASERIDDTTIVPGTNKNYTPELVGYMRSDGTFVKVDENDPINLALNTTTGSGESVGLESVQKIGSGVYQLNYNLPVTILMNSSSKTVGAGFSTDATGKVLLNRDSLVFRMNVISDKFVAQNPVPGFTAETLKDQVQYLDLGFDLVSSSLPLTVPTAKKGRLYNSSWGTNTGGNKRSGAIWKGGLRKQISSTSGGGWSSNLGPYGSYDGSVAKNGTMVAKWDIYHYGNAHNQTTMYPNAFTETKTTPASAPLLNNSIMSVVSTVDAYEEAEMRASIKTSIGTTDYAAKGMYYELVTVDRSAITSYNALFGHETSTTEIDDAIKSFAYTYYGIDDVIPASKRVVGVRLRVAQTEDKNGNISQTYPSFNLGTLKQLDSNVATIYSSNTKVYWNNYTMRSKAITAKLVGPVIKNASSASSDIFSPDLVEATYTIETGITPGYEDVPGVVEWYNRAEWASRAEGSRIAPLEFSIGNARPISSNSSNVEIVSVMYNGVGMDASQVLDTTSGNSIVGFDESPKLKDINGKEVKATLRLKDINAATSFPFAMGSNDRAGAPGYIYVWDPLIKSKMSVGNLPSKMISWIEPYYAGVTKYTSTPVVRENSPFEYNIVAFNKYVETTPAGSKILDVLPENKDSRGSEFEGSIKVTDLSVTSVTGNVDKDAVKFYTTTQKIPETVNLKDVKVTDYGLKLYTGGDVDAKSVIAVLPELPTGTAVYVKAILKGVNNKDASVYVNNAQFGPTPGNTTNILSNDVEVNVVTPSRKILGSAFWDLDNTGTLTTDLVQKTIPLTLYQVDAEGKETVVTKDADGKTLPALSIVKGKYSINNLAPGTYFVAANLSSLKNDFLSISPFKNAMAFEAWKTDIVRTKNIVVPDKDKFTQTANLGLVRAASFTDTVTFKQNGQVIDNKEVSSGTVIQGTETLNVKTSGFAGVVQVKPSYLSGITDIKNAKWTFYDAENKATNVAFTVEGGVYKLNLDYVSQGRYEFTYDATIAPATDPVRVAQNKPVYTGLTSELSVDGGAFTTINNAVPALYGSVKPSVTKTVDKASAKVGEELTYTITLKNDTGASPWFNVSLIDQLPAELSFVKNSLVIDGTASTVDLSTTPVPVQKVIAGQSVVVSFKALITKAPANKTVVNIAKASGKNSNTNGANVDAQGQVGAEAKNNALDVYHYVVMDKGASAKGLATVKQASTVLTANGALYPVVTSVAIDTVSDGTNNIFIETNVPAWVKGIAPSAQVFEAKATHTLIGAIDETTAMSAQVAPVEFATTSTFVGTFTTSTGKPAKAVITYITAKQTAGEYSWGY